MEFAFFIQQLRNQFLISCNLSSYYSLPFVRSRCTALRHTNSDVNELAVVVFSIDDREIIESIKIFFKVMRQILFIFGTHIVCKKGSVKSTFKIIPC